MLGMEGGGQRRGCKIKLAPLKKDPRYTHGLDQEHCSYCKPEQLIIIKIMIIIKKVTYKN